MEPHPTLSKGEALEKDLGEALEKIKVRLTQPSPKERALEKSEVQVLSFGEDE